MGALNAHGLLPPNQFRNLVSLAVSATRAASLLDRQQVREQLQIAMRRQRNIVRNKLERATAQSAARQEVQALRAQHSQHASRG